MDDQDKIEAVLNKAHDVLDFILHRVGKIYIALGEEVPDNAKPRKAIEEGGVKPSPQSPSSGGCVGRGAASQAGSTPSGKKG